MIALPSTVSAVEVAWTAMALLGLIKVSLVLVMCSLVLLTGLVAMQVPEPVRPSVQDAADFLATCLLVMDALLLALAVAFFWERRYVVPHVHMLRDRG
jgi:hypothetical protein